jgi:hypothetical protein
MRKVTLWVDEEGIPDQYARHHKAEFVVVRELGSRLHEHGIILSGAHWGWEILSSESVEHAGKRGWYFSAQQVVDAS